MKDLRIHRIAMLRSDEARHLEREALGHVGERACCAHLGIFHTCSRGDFGERYVCNVSGCGCIDEYPPSALAVAMREEDKQRAQREHSETFVRAWMLGLALGLFIGFWIGWTLS